MLTWSGTSKKKETVMIAVPKIIVQILAPTASKYDVSSTAMSSILFQTVSAGAGDIASLPLSRRQVERSTKASLTEKAINIKKTLMKTARDKYWVCHFDGKQLAEFKKLLEFVKKLAVVNDAGERGVKGIQEVVGKTTKESLRQDMLLTTAEERKLHAKREGEREGDQG
jgi:hypothetical protein